MLLLQTNVKFRKNQRIFMHKNPRHVVVSNDRNIQRNFKHYFKECRPDVTPYIKCVSIAYFTIEIVGKELQKVL